MSAPTITVFGSCRVVFPCQILRNRKDINLNQNNIFGFTHVSPDVYQQFRIISGELAFPRRLKPYLNIPEAWIAPEKAPLDNFYRKFEATDIYVVEISSIRKVIFKAFYLQVNRTREILADNPQVVKDWWEPLVRTGVNKRDRIPTELTGTRRDVAEGLTVFEQSVDELYADLVRIRNFLRKPVLFVAHFNTDKQGKEIPQRRCIVDALRRLDNHSAIVDPTTLVRDFGINEAISDLSHYQKSFEPLVADLIFEGISRII